MDWLLALALFLIIPVSVIGFGAMFLEWKDRGLPIPVRPRPSLVFRIVKREDRAAYVRMMRRTYAVALRDANRAITKFGREIGKRLLPTIQRLSAVLGDAFK
jgi:hypothetical protein